MEGTTIKRNRLTRAQTNRLVIWLLQNKDMLNNHAATLEKAAKLADHDLQLFRDGTRERVEITTKTISNLISETAALDWRSSGPISQAQAFSLLAANLRHTMKAAGLKVPLVLLHMAEGKVETHATNGGNSIRNLFPETCEG